MIHVVVECEYELPFDKQTWYEEDLRLLPCLEANGATWIRSQVSLDGRRTICEFEAPDAEAVRSAYRRTAIAFQQVWVAEVIDPSLDWLTWVKKPHPVGRLAEYPSVP